MPSNIESITNQNALVVLIALLFFMSFHQSPHFLCRENLFPSESFHGMEFTTYNHYAKSYHRH